jgi:hypothetical protein
MLFSQLIDAGVEAGGATAQALVQGGADTISEVNGLFAELDALGKELGENTAQVMYGQGELFVNGIVAGLGSQLAELESSANSLAEAFTTTFEDVLIAGINQAIDAAEAALRRMPSVPGFTPPTAGDRSGSGSGTRTGADGGRTSGGAGITSAILGSTVSAAGARLAAAASISPYRPDQSLLPRSPAPNYTPPGLGFTYNLYSASPSIIRNATAGAANTGGSSFLQRRNSLNGGV